MLTCGEFGLVAVRASGLLGYFIRSFISRDIIMAWGPCDFNGVGRVRVEGEGVLLCGTWVAPEAGLYGSIVVHEKMNVSHRVYASK